MSLNPRMATPGKSSAPGEMAILWGDEKDRFPSTFEVPHGRPTDKQPTLSAGGAADQASSEDSTATENGRILMGPDRRLPLRRTKRKLRVLAISQVQEDKQSQTRLAGIMLNALRPAS